MFNTVTTHFIQLDWDLENQAHGPNGQGRSSSCIRSDRSSNVARNGPTFSPSIIRPRNSIWETWARAYRISGSSGFGVADDEGGRTCVQGLAQAWLSALGDEHTSQDCAVNGKEDDRNT
ncbi:hypothetical protein FIE12Z_8198 [Fusarium flagelliforme]|uniref:Uncharacterized protein n=1 Tax=Fusarium flagelliforme TaxID=2675880 RepID=A0A395MI22_9HYPO|nr:hypothetical protein FIE12Z_8198 [Fusarium flagelliforme]